MEVRNLFDPAVKEDIITRINKLTPQSKGLWGKMTVGQMLAHLQVPIGVAEGTRTLKRTFFARLVGPLVKSVIYNEKPFKRGLPTDPSFVMTGSEKDFETEKQKLLSMINNFTEVNMVNEIHPFFGRMTKEQWSKGTWKHLDHHLQQFGV
ncbi:MAG: DUF1569 domain-containing protein [Bacteroidota bacterium]|nr:DUF1569 domain-containing protein [Bacteroidota bacterium]